ncbi:MAG: PAS domain S-box protein, partial [Cytophagales bacterium]|nr:PAS domain S-box protein [Cytophagales bacterium]
MDKRFPKDLLFDAIWEDAHTLVFLLDGEGRLTDANPAFYRVTGYAAGDMAGHSPGQILTGGARDWVFPAGPEAKPAFSQEWITRTGAVVSVEWSAAAFADASGQNAFLCTGKAIASEKINKLQKKADWLSRIGKLGKIGYWEHNLVEDTLEASQQTIDLFGLSHGEEPVLHGAVGAALTGAPYRLDAIAGLMTEAGRAQFMHDVRAAMQAKSPFAFSFAVRVNGVARQMHTQGDFLLDPAGNITHIIGTSRDITQQYEYEQQLAFKEKVLDAVSEAIVATDTKLTITAWNKGAERIYGWKAEEALGKDGRQLLQNIMIDEINYHSALEAVQTTGTITTRVSQLRKDGQRIPILSVSNKILDEHQHHIGYLALNRDISDLVCMEKELQYRQNLLKTIIDTSPASIYLLDHRGRVLEINATCRRTFFDRFGVTVAAGDVLTEKLSVGLVPGMNDRMEDAFRGKTVTGEASYPDGDGSEQTIEYSLHPVCNHSGEITAVATYARNISERKRLQQQTLAQELAAQRLKAASLIAGQEQERVRLVAELHDGIGQMLNVLKLKIDTLAEGPPPAAYRLWALSGFTSQIIAEIKLLVQDAMPYNLEHLGLDGAIRNLCAQYESQGKVKVQFRVWVTLTQSRFEKPLEMFVYRVVQESLNNAIRHARARNITVQLTQFPGHLLLMVEDDGVGFRVADALQQTAARGGLKHLTERCRLVGAAP